LHLLEFGLAWPPDTFLREKYTGLARGGVRITVVSYRQSEQPLLIPGVELVPMPARGLAIWRVVLGIGADLVRLARRRPRRAGWLLSKRARSLMRHEHGPSTPYSPTRRDRLEWIWLLVRLAPFQPDVVHIEWESVAVAWLPVLDLWSCPSVMSCHGGLDVYARSLFTAGWVAEVPRAFARVSAVHCVSDAMLAEALRHGLPQDKAFVLRAGIDTGRFVPAGS
jgi:glycosyltransferase involved in cell wall biosynthesis